MRELTDGRSLSTRTRIHSVLIDNRERVVINGVDDVDNFNENEVNLMTAAGYLMIKGSNLHISKLSLEEGQLVIEGQITGVEYEDKDPATGFWSKVFR